MSTAQLVPFSSRLVERAGILLTWIQGPQQSGLCLPSMVSPLLDLPHWQKSGEVRMTRAHVAGQGGFGSAQSP